MAEIKHVRIFQRKYFSQKRTFLFLITHKGNTSPCVLEYTRKRTKSNACITNPIYRIPIQYPEDLISSILPDESLYRLPRTCSFEDKSLIKTAPGKMG
ncbi:hypothetical protein CEXT_744631 [Caerostris extrusa]|uniref:Uncharacterized protein n=1 Tax=Caerostris extrusa TaxID=172846 RepID=A0AAV4RHR6_CAEEX|nr:hypothetical protein CEXT_744631 [Caerostris extrusa]